LHRHCWSIVNQKIKIDFSSITAKYFDDKNALDPLGATQNGQTNITINYNLKLIALDKRSLLF
jgi:hypothetical protein